MDKETLKRNLTKAVQDYLAEEETYDDNAQLQIDPQTGTVNIVDSGELQDEGIDIEADPAGMDYYDVMDFVMMNPAVPGQWIVDTEAVDSVADEY